MDNCHSTIALLLVVFTNGVESTCLAHMIGSGVALEVKVEPIYAITVSFGESWLSLIANSFQVKLASLYPKSTLR